MLRLLQFIIFASFMLLCALAAGAQDNPVHAGYMPWAKDADEFHRAGALGKANLLSDTTLRAGEGLSRGTSVQDDTLL